jgi:HD-like signal output (HDOD) protein
MKYKILLVENNIFKIENVKKVLEDKYEVSATSSATEALNMLQNNDIDMLFADIRIDMPDGRNFLEKVKNTYPDVLRVILGESEEDYSVINAISHNIARACILKPWDVNALVLSNKIFAIEERLKEAKFFSYFIKLEDLPTINASYQRVLNLIDSDDDMEDIAGAIGTDPSMAAKILRIANSAYYGIKTTSINQAVTYLGISNIRDLVLSTAIFDMFNTEDVPEKIFQSLWQQSFVCSKIVNLTYKMIGKRTPTHASLAGLLMNIGIIFLLKQFNKNYIQIIQEIKQLNGAERNLSLENLEIDTFGSTHSEIGGYLLKWWEIPYPIVEAAIFHHNPLNENVIDKELLCIIHLAEHYSAKVIYMDSSMNDIEECFKYLKLDKSVFETKIDEVIAH